MEKWVLAAKRADFQEIGRKYGIDPVIARIIRNRDITEDAEINQYLNGTLDDIPSWKSLKDIDKAVEIISQKIDLGTRMRIIGDYDIDGVTATYILLKGFKRLGANGVSMENVAKMLGHADTSVTKHYARVLDQNIFKDMQKVNSCLSELAI